MRIPTVAEIRKAIVAAIGLAGMVVSAGLLHGRLLLDVEAGIAILTSIVHYSVPNRPAAPAASKLGLSDAQVADALAAAQAAPEPAAPAAVPPAAP